MGRKHTIRRKSQPAKHLATPGRQSTAGCSYQRTFEPYCNSFFWRFPFLFMSAVIAAALIPRDLMEPVNTWTAGFTAAWMAIIGFDILTPGATVLSLGGFSARIVPECTPLYPLLMMAAFILAYPATCRQKVIGLALSSAILVLINTFRLAVLVLIGWKLPAFFDWSHVLLGQVAMVVAVVAHCAWYVGHVKKNLSWRIWCRFLLWCSAASAILFLAWAGLNRIYIQSGDSLIREIFSWWGYRLIIPVQHSLYYQTFSIVVVGAMALTIRDIRAAERIRWLFLGAGVAGVLHLCIRVCNVLVTGFGNETASAVTPLALALSQYLVPVLFWVVISRIGSTAQANSINANS